MNYIDLSVMPVALLLVQALLPLLSFLTSIYFLFVFLMSPRRRKQPIPQTLPNKRFLVVIPARNEEQVLPRLLASIKCARYPEEFLKVVVVADNCTDQTVLIAQKMGVEVLERHDLASQSKASALYWAFYQQGLLERGFDALTIMDADNGVDPDFFLHVAIELQKGAQIIQGRRQAINAEESFVTSVMSIIYSFENRLWFLPHANQNRSTIMLGTGATIDCDCLKKIGWSVRTLVEDAEFSIHAVFAGVNIRYCDDAIVQVEMPVSVKALWRQLRRWFSGQIACSRLYLPAVFRKVCRDRGGSAVVLLITLIIPFNCTAGLIQLLLGPLTAYLMLGSNLPLAVIAVWLIGSHLAVMSCAIAILLLDGRLQLKCWKGILIFPFLQPFYGAVYLFSYLFPQKSWKLMVHRPGEK